MLTILDHTDSTNNYAMRLIRDGAASHCDGVAALNQTAGKGQRGKNWQGQEGKNIALSVIADAAKFKGQQQFYLSMAVAMAAVDFVSKYVTEDVALKWPNDVYWQSCKAGGILIENVFTGTKWKWAVAGVGINVNQTSFPKPLPNPVSLRQITGREFDVSKLCRELYDKIVYRIDTLKQQQGNELLDEYNSRLYLRNKNVKLKKGPLTFNTTVLGVTAQGQLHTQDAIERFFDFGEVEWLL